ncbi:cold shock domain-containing protein [Roseiconus nitratireducens]|uniref:Cold shock domain-containing protein n=1 Tax=Roseiconus nitratireducens TaxID=2605748 RepID=A0A5M6D736_9BACT|nr:cold shock domain-containing protein [Roseiconus nitratireducens]KAA5541005.1 cold shock domain-containing protein [Roseiconus nitratireducens]
MTESQSPPPGPPPEDERPKKFRITRKRLGVIRFVDPNGEYGFIDAEDFRDDVFFHRSVWQTGGAGPGGPLSSQTGPGGAPGPNRGHRGGPPPGANKLVPEELVKRVVEFEIDDELFEGEQKLRATIVRPTRRPMGRKLSGRDATFQIITHHPKARRKRPDWRK